MAEAKDRPRGLLSFLSIEVSGIKLSTVLLGVLAILGAVPLIKALLASYITEPLILSTAAVILSAVAAYYLLLAETASEKLQKNAVSFVVIAVLLIIVAYMYIPTIRIALSEGASETIGQVVTLLAR